MSTGSETKSNSDNPTTSSEAEQAEKVEVGLSKFNCQKIDILSIRCNTFNSRNYHGWLYFCLR